MIDALFFRGREKVVIHCQSFYLLCCVLPFLRTLDLPIFRPLRSRLPVRKWSARCPAQAGQLQDKGSGKGKGEGKSGGKGKGKGKNAEVPGPKGKGKGKTKDKGKGKGKEAKGYKGAKGGKNNKDKQWW